MMIFEEMSYTIEQPLKVVIVLLVIYISFFVQVTLVSLIYFFSIIFLTFKMLIDFKKQKTGVLGLQSFLIYIKYLTVFAMMVFGLGKLFDTLSIFKAQDKH
jgi:hypothetical protein